MLNEKMVALGTQRSVIRELFEYGKQRAAEVGPENVFDFIACHLRFADKYLLQCQWNHFAEYWILCLYFLKYFFSGPSCSKYQK